MEILKTLFWILLFTVFYTYVGYGIVLYVMVLIKRYFFKNKSNIYNSNKEPEVTVFIPAYNEKDYVDQKMTNTMRLNYPKDKLKIIWVTDGSNDGTNEMVKRYDNVQLFHNSERKGKYT